MSKEHEKEWPKESGLIYDVRVAGDLNIKVEQGATLIINSGEPVDPPPPDSVD